MKERFGNQASLCNVDNVDSPVLDVAVTVITFTKQTYIPYSEEDIRR